MEDVNLHIVVEGLIMLFKLKDFLIRCILILILKLINLIQIVK